MEWFQNLLNGENGSAIQLIFITLLLVIGLILIVWIFRRIAGSPARRAARNRIPRLSITDSAAVDDKRYLVLVRRDNVEHLVLIGGPTDIVVENNIMRVQQSTQTAPSAEKTSVLATQPSAATPQQKEEKTAEPEIPVAAATTALAGAAVVSATSQAEEFQDTSDLTSETPSEPTIVPEAEIESELSPEIAFDEIEEALTEVAPSAVEPMEPVIEAVQETTSPMEPAEQTAPPIETVAEPNLEDAISQQLDDALGGETFAADPQSADIQPETHAKPGSDDEMQRLLDELAGESKEKA